MASSSCAESAAKACSVFLVAALCLVSTAVQGQDRKSTPLWETVPTNEVPPAAPAVTGVRIVRVDVERLVSGDNSRFSLPMPDGQTVEIVKTREQPMPNSGLVWHGKIVGDAYSSVTLSAVKAVVVGAVHSSRGAVYRLRFWKGDLHLAERLDPAQLPDELPPRPLHPQPQAMSLEAGACATDSSEQIDVLVAYTSAARAAAPGTDAMVATVYLTIEQANQSYIESDVKQRLGLVHVMEVNYTETDNFVFDLEHLDDPTDMELDEVVTMRDLHAADAAVLITEKGNCGDSIPMVEPNNSLADHAFAIVTLECARSRFSVPHELGHIMGARHEPTLMDTEDRPFPYGRPHIEPQPSPPAPPPSPWQTIMATKNACDPVLCERLPRWSDPSKYWGTDAMGELELEHNSRALDASAHLVANYRCSSPDRPDTWMKDTWSDTGAEPDPNQSAQPMWKSPYIWIRHSSDPNRMYQHEHENPQSGQEQFINVKLHNGGEPALGTLEVYGALASTGLSWPNDWSRLVSIPTSIPGHASTIVEAPWTPTAVGHYCLVARWVSAADPMTTPEGPDLSANVRANNNLIWRNVNIIDLVSGTSSTAQFIVRNVNDQTTQFRLSIQPNTQHSGSFVDVGKITLTLPRDLQRHWSKNRYAGSGFRLSRGSGNVIVTDPRGAVLDRLRLPPRFEAKVGIRFERPATRFSRDQYQLDVVQSVSKRDGTGDVIGGVTYEIRTTRLGRR
jgi:hypothetical protein